MARNGYDHDAIVIGGGPAGATFARMLASQGRDVLIIDKRKELGVPVRCGEVLGVSKLTGEGLELPRSAYSTRIRGARIYAPNGKSITWAEEGMSGWVLERKFFDKWLNELAVEKGAKVRTYTRALSVLKDAKGRPEGVLASHGGREPFEIRAPLIVSAEGMESLMARQMGFKTVHSLYDVDTCYEYEMKPYDHEGLIEIFFGNALAPRGYAWIFPKDGRKANVGIGIGGNLETDEKRGGIRGADPKRFLDDYVAGHPKLKDASTLLDFGGVISVGAPINEFVKDNCMVVGTAAKQVDPIHGGGIALAIESGMLAANAAVAAFGKNDFSREVLYNGYERPWREGLGKGLASRLLLRKVMEKLGDDDLNHIFNVLRQDDLPGLMDGNFAPAVAKVLAGRPQLIGALGALLPRGK
jgi:digeranylgeranylglycerophospholipid reductase